MSDIIEELELQKFKKTIIQRIENQELDLVLDPLFNCICDRVTYEKNRNLMEWECAICGAKIIVSKIRNDIENFVCVNCREAHNNKNTVVDRRILDSRTRMFKLMEDNIYNELETRLNS